MPADGLLHSPIHLERRRWHVPSRRAALSNTTSSPAHPKDLVLARGAAQIIRSKSVTQGTFGVKICPDSSEIQLLLYPRKQTQLGHHAMSERSQFGVVLGWSPGSSVKSQSKAASVGGLFPIPARVSKETAPAKGETEAVFDALEQLFCCSPFSRSGAPCA